MNRKFVSQSFIIIILFEMGYPCELGPQVDIEQTKN